MIKVAIPVLSNLLSMRFGECSHYETFEIDNKAVLYRKEEVPPVKLTSELPAWLEHSGITDVIAHSIDKALLPYFTESKINLYVGVQIKSPEELIEEYLKGSLRSNSQIIG